MRTLHEIFCLALRAKRRWRDAYASRGLGYCHSSVDGSGEESGFVLISRFWEVGTSSFPKSGDQYRFFARTLDNWVVRDQERVSQLSLLMMAKVPDTHEWLTWRVPRPYPIPHARAERIPVARGVGCGVGRVVGRGLSAPIHGPIGIHGAVNPRPTVGNRNTAR